MATMKFSFRSRWRNAVEVYDLKGLPAIKAGFKIAFVLWVLRPICNFSMKHFGTEIYENTNIVLFPWEDLETRLNEFGIDGNDFICTMFEEIYY